MSLDDENNGIIVEGDDDLPEWLTNLNKNIFTPPLTPEEFNELVEFILRDELTRKMKYE